MKKSYERIVIEEFIKKHPHVSNKDVMDYMQLHFKYDRARVSDIISKIKSKEDCENE